MRVKWAVELDGEVHMIELDHGDYSGRKTIKQVRVPRLLYGDYVQGSGRHPGRS